MFSCWLGSSTLKTRRGFNVANIKHKTTAIHRCFVCVSMCVQVPCPYKKSMTDKLPPPPTHTHFFLIKVIWHWFFCNASISILTLYIILNKNTVMLFYCICAVYFVYYHIGCLLIRHASNAHNISMPQFIK